MTTDNTPLTVALTQLAAHHEQLTQLDTREAGHHTAVTERLAGITDLLTAIRRLVDDHQAALARIESVDWHVPDVAVQLAGTGPAGTRLSRYRPSPAPAWWKLAPADRAGADRATAGLGGAGTTGPATGAWPPTLAPCWESHDLCLYGLDILSALWSVLYLQPRRTAGLLTAQAEYQSRILPALADQLRLETNRCGHPRNPVPLTGTPRSMP